MRLWKFYKNIEFRPYCYFPIISRWEIDFSFSFPFPINGKKYIFHFPKFGKLKYISNFNSQCWEEKNNNPNFLSRNWEVICKFLFHFSIWKLCFPLGYVNGVKYPKLGILNPQLKIFYLIGDWGIVPLVLFCWLKNTQTPIGNIIPNWGYVICNWGYYLQFWFSLNWPTWPL